MCSASPTLSNPPADESSGNNSRTRTSTPSKSRSVFSYSTRFSRRSTTRPSFARCAAFSASTSPVSQSTAARFSSGVGRGLDFGGISPVSIFSSAFCHSLSSPCPSAAAPASGRPWARLRCGTSRSAAQKPRAPPPEEPPHARRRRPAQGSEREEHQDFERDLQGRTDVHRTTRKGAAFFDCCRWQEIAFAPAAPSVGCLAHSFPSSSLGTRVSPKLRCDPWR